MRCRILKKRKEVKKQLKMLKPSQKEHREAAQRYLWHVDGLFKTNASWKALNAIKVKYKELGLVPQGYNYADLWLQKVAKPR